MQLVCRALVATVVIVVGVCLAQVFYSRLKPLAGTVHTPQGFYGMQGINRLGKAAPKPGSLRPPDPNRRQDLDLFSEGAETDADYMRMVHDVRLLITPYRVLCQRMQQAEMLLLVQIEDTQQNQSGWLFGRGGELFAHIHTVHRSAGCCYDNSLIDLRLSWFNVHLQLLTRETCCT